jgi:hypothetical protein
MSRKELQAVAKEHGLKANKSNTELVKELLTIFSAVEAVVEKINNDISSVECLTNNDIAVDDDGPLSTGDSVTVDGEMGNIVRLNKKTVRVQLQSGKEITVKFEEVTRIQTSQLLIEQDQRSTEMKTKQDNLPPEIMDVATLPENGIDFFNRTFSSPKLKESPEVGPFSIPNRMFSPRSVKKVSLCGRILSTETPRTKEKVLQRLIY